MASRRKPRHRSFEEEDEGPWTPKTELGRKVASGEIVSIDQVLEMGKPILEYQIVNKLLPGMKNETLEVKNTQRMTSNGRKMQFRAVVLVGDGNGHLGIGVGKAEETRPAISSAVKNAKRNVIRVPLGSGSWEESGRDKPHTVPIKVMGKNGSVEVTIKPAPPGVGVVGNDIVKKVLSAAGVKDAWTFGRGRTRTIYNTAIAVFNALDSLNRMKVYRDWEPEEAPVQAVEAAKQEIPAEASAPAAAAEAKPETPEAPAVSAAAVSTAAVAKPEPSEKKPEKKAEVKKEKAEGKAAEKAEVKKEAAYDVPAEKAEEKKEDEAGKSAA